jgi:hypothetical protein
MSRASNQRPRELEVLARMHRLPTSMTHQVCQEGASIERECLRRTFARIAELAQKSLFFEARSNLVKNSGVSIVPKQRHNHACR